jgi:hypothetical protein
MPYAIWSGMLLCSSSPWMARVDSERGMVVVWRGPVVVVREVGWTFFNTRDLREIGGSSGIRLGGAVLANSKLLFLEKTVRRARRGLACACDRWRGCCGLCAFPGPWRRREGAGWYARGHGRESVNVTVPTSSWPERECIQKRHTGRRQMGAMTTAAIRLQPPVVLLGTLSLSGGSTPAHGQADETNAWQRRLVHP